MTYFTNFFDLKIFCEMLLVSMKTILFFSRKHILCPLEKKILQPDTVNYVTFDVTTKG